MNSYPAISVVIPVYQSEKSLPPLIEQLETALKALSLPDFEVIMVNDASRDNSWKVIQTLSVEKPWIRGICLMRNYGQHNAVLCGIRAARFPVVVTIDDDLQHPPGEIVKLMNALNDETDVVYGTPEKEQHGLWRDLASVVTKMALQSAMGTTIARKVSAFRLFRTKLRDAFATYSSPYVSVDVLLTWGSTRFTSVKVRHDPRTIGKSNYTFSKLARHAMNMITGFSAVPLRLATFIGFGFALFGGLLLVYLLINYFVTGGGVQGFTFLASVISLFSGVQLFALGIMGEYLARMHFRMMDRPSYTVRVVTGDTT
ncbi:MAG: glycosyltransferase [Planctomycetia bacterium]|nr:glycosyltransferase [Planctomycetia bacterium]